MDVLWHDLPDVSPVIRTLPVELWEEKALVPSNKNSGAEEILKIHLKRMPSPAECSGALRNASRVKAIRFGNWQWNKSPSEDILYGAESYEALHTLREYCATYSTSAGVPRTLFPTLHTLHWDWYIGDAETFTELPFFVPEDLRTLEIKGLPPTASPVEAAMVDDSFSRLLKRCASLKVVQLRFEHDGRLAGCEYLERITELPLLETYRPKFPLSVSSLLRLGKHARLRDLSVNMKPDIDERSMSSVTPGSLFPSARHLKIGSSQLAVCTQIIKAVQSTLLESLVVRVEGQTEVTHTWLHSFLTALCRQRSLLRVSLKPSRYPERASQSYSTTPPSITMTTLRPLLVLPYINDISLHFHDTIVQITDRDIEAISKALPGLRHFGIFSESPFQPRPEVSLDGIFLLVRNCPKLASISLSVDFTPPTEDLRRMVREWAGARDCCHSRSLHVAAHCTQAFEEVTDTEELAQFFANLLPSRGDFHCTQHFTESVGDAEYRLICKRWRELSNRIWKLQGRR
ncbi:hypothetical protein EIP91_003035 [Steccherinum ochraceum]|uniref:F-box domain-containing protein n=1 Tax=Steccherinum ochraceum TaxID=92696 RepID=A0A4R0RCQ2_9APHY|nr:hypothetical protein EIP91_003035 [Steccherinum ochraceum]